MSKSLHLDSEPLVQPAAIDRLERATWSSLRVRVGARTITRLYDKQSNSERTWLYIPTFPIADWLVQNWWAILNEPSRSDTVPQPDAEEPGFSWTKRHCFRASESGLLLPALYLFGDDREIRCEWRADPEGALPHFTGEFVDSGKALLERTPTEAALGQFVNDTLYRMEDIDDRRSEELRETWRAIVHASSEERQFCAIVGRMGLDPYDLGHQPAGFAEMVERIGEVSEPWVNDLTLVVQPDELEAKWEWVRAASRRYALGHAPRTFDGVEGRAGRSAAHYGYAVARDVRRVARVSGRTTVRSLEAVAREAFDIQLDVQDLNHISGRNVSMIAGWKDDRSAVLVGPRQPVTASDRFRIARGLFHLLSTTEAGPRLITSAYTWDQQASRAFAAELLAPQHALKAEVGDWADSEDIQRLAGEFDVSGIVIEKQLRNAGVQVGED